MSRKDRLLQQITSAPNQLTLLRLVFVPFIATSVMEGDYRLALVLFVLAGISDGLDGMLARWMDQRTVLGQYLDPIADKLLLSTMFLVLSVTRDIPWRITVLVFSRDIGILLVCAVLYMTTNLRDFSPSLYGKANTLAQIIALLLALLQPIANTANVGQAKQIALWVVFGLTLFSGLHYIVLVGKRLREVGNHAS